MKSHSKKERIRARVVRLTETDKRILKVGLKARMEIRERKAEQRRAAFSAIK